MASALLGVCVRPAFASAPLNCLCFCSSQLCVVSLCAIQLLEVNEEDIMKFIPAQHDPELVAALVDALKKIAAALEATAHEGKVLELRRKFAGILEFAKKQRAIRRRQAEQAIAARLNEEGTAPEGTGSAAEGAPKQSFREPLPQDFIAHMTDALGDDLRGRALATRIPGYLEWLEKLVTLGCAENTDKAEAKVGITQTC